MGFERTDTDTDGWRSENEDCLEVALLGGSEELPVPVPVPVADPDPLNMPGGLLLLLLLLLLVDAFPVDVDAADDPPR